MEHEALKGYVGVLLSEGYEAYDRYAANRCTGRIRPWSPTTRVE